MTEPTYVIQHDCLRDDHSYRAFGPFATRDDASAFIERHDLTFPLDGGYAFAAVVPPLDAQDPAVYDAMYPDEDDEDE
jgi:hypothetical protein